MTSDQSTGNVPTPQIALVGTTGAGKSVFTAMLAKYLERKRDGVWLFPKGGRPKSTFVQLDEWWSALQGGNWLPATTPGTLIELEWDFFVHDQRIPLRMFDYAGENLTDLFSGKQDNATGAAKEFFEKVRAAFESASVLLVLINLETFIEQDASSQRENKGTLIRAMTTFLDNKLERGGRSRRVCFVFTAYDRYEPVILEKWGSVENFLEQKIPQLYDKYVHKQSNVRVLAVAAVNETEIRVDPHDGKAIRYPKPGFRSIGFTQLVNWLVAAVGDAKSELDVQAAESAQDEQNIQFVEWLAKEWNAISSADQLAPVERFLDMVRQGFPYPQRPSAAQLKSQQLAYFNAANDLRAMIEERLVTARREFYTKSLKIAVPALVLMFVLFFVMSTYNNEVERQRLATQQAEAERLREPSPKIDGKWGWNYTCNTGILDCWEHRATATVLVKNEGGAGNVTVTFEVGNQSASKIVYFNQDESSYVSVTINKMSSHTATKGDITVQASK